MTTLSDVALRRRLFDNEGAMLLVFVTAPKGEPFGEHVAVEIFTEESGVEFGVIFGVALAMVEHGGFTPFGCALLLIGAALCVAFRSRDERLSFFDREAARARRGVSHIVL